MGPAVILDKSAVQAIGKKALRVQSEFFYTVITPVLVWEICGDIQKANEGKCEPEKVKELARKVHPVNSIATTEWRKLCIGELCGYRFEMGTGSARRPVVDGGHRVPEPRGGYGVIIDDQPESQALRRWERGKWTPSDEQYAHAWRRASKNIDLELVRKKYSLGSTGAVDLACLKQQVGSTLRDPSLQYYFLTLLADEMQLNDPLRGKILRRWLGRKSQFWQARCPFSRYCLKTFMTFYMAVGGGLVGTRSTNRVDLEYLLYAPFAPIFISGDEGTHAKLAPLLLENDQRFVLAREFKAALDAHVAHCEEVKSKPDATRDLYEPPAGSLIRDLWISAWGKFRPPPSTWSTGGSPKDPEVKTIAQTFADAMKYVDANPDQYPKRPPWPSI